MIELLNEGKTKQIIPLDSATNRIRSKDDLTAGDGKMHDVLPGKGELANRTTCNVFALLKDCGIPVAFFQQDSPDSFLSPVCEMILWEVVVRRKGEGSFLKRNPAIPKGTRLEPLVTEFYLKTKGRRWKQYNLPCDDPYAIITQHSVFLYRPDEPVRPGSYFLKLSHDEVFEPGTDVSLIPQIRDMAENVFRILELAWSLADPESELADFKLEFGRTTTGRLLVADVIDADSWRVLRNLIHMSKQAYRDGEDLARVLEKYKWTAEVTSIFPSLQEQILTAL